MRRLLISLTCLCIAGYVQAQNNSGPLSDNSGWIVDGSYSTYKLTQNEGVSSQIDIYFDGSDDCNAWDAQFVTPCWKNLGKEGDRFKLSFDVKYTGDFDEGRLRIASGKTYPYNPDYNQGNNTQIVNYYGNAIVYNSDYSVGTNWVRYEYNYYLGEEGADSVRLEIDHGYTEGTMSFANITLEINDTVKYQYLKNDKVNTVKTIGFYTYQFDGNTASISNHSFPTDTTAITIPASVTSGGIKYDVKYVNCYFDNLEKLQSITIEGDQNLQYANLYFTKDSISYQVVDKNSVAITGTSHLNDFSIPATVTAGNTFAVTNIGYRAFYYNTALTNAKIPATVARIEQYAFYNCKSLKSVTIPSNVSYIGWNAFSNCDSITSVTIGTESSTISNARLSFTSDSIKYTVLNYDEVELTLFNKKTFNAIPEKVTAGSTFNVTTIADNAFRNCTFVVDSIQYTLIDLKTVKVSYCLKQNGGKLVIPSTVTSNGSTFTVTEIGNNAFDGSPMSEITIPETVTKIGAAFQNCDSLKSITIPNSVESIGGYAFQYCNYLETVVLPNGLKSISYNTFYDCNSLKSIVIPNSVTSIGYMAFGYCYGLESIVIPNSVTYIDNYAFSYCEKLKNIVIGSSLNDVGYQSFANCDSIENITVFNTTPPSASSTFGNIHDTVLNKITLRVPQGSKDKYQSDDNYPWNKMNIVEFAAYNVTLAAQGGEATFTGGGLYEAGTNTKAVVSVKPNKGYLFVKWSDGNTDNPRTISLTKDTTLTALFADKFCNITLLVDNDKHGYIKGSTRVREGYWADYYAYGVGEYTFDHWDNGSTYNNQGFSIISDTTIKAFFKKRELHQVTVTSNDYTMGTVSECTSVWSGEYIYVYAQANDGFRFVKWSDENTNDYNREIRVVSDTSIVAYFEPVPQCKVRFFVADSCKQMGTVFCADATVAKGNEVTVQATPNDGYIFKGWYTAKGKQRSSNAYLQFNVKRDTTLYAHFAPKPNYAYIPYSGIEKLSIAAGQTVKIYDSEGPERNCLKGGEGQLIITVPKGYCIKISGTSDIDNNDYLAPFDIKTGDFYTRWYGKDTTEFIIADTIGGLYFENSHSGYKGFELEATAVKWADVIPYNIGLTVNDTALGKASILFAMNTDTTNYEILLYAENKRGGRFNCWPDGYDWIYHHVDVTSDTSFVATFDTLKAYTVTIQSADTAMGKINGCQSGIYYSNEEVYFESITKSPEFSFVKWSDGVTDHGRYFYPYQDTTIIAEFKRNKAYTVNFVSSDTTLGTVLNSGTYYEGQTAYPNVKTKENCFFTSWSDGGDYSWRGLRVVSDTTIIANFEKMPYKFTIQASDTNMGYAGHYSVNRVTSNIYEVTVYTRTMPGYVFTNWSDGFVNQHTVYIVSDTVLTANFEPIKYKINFDEGENGRISAGYATKRGDIITMEMLAIPDEGYCFAGWNDTVMQLSRTFAISSDTTIAARFAKFPYNIEVTCNKAQGTVGYSTQSASLNDPYVHFFAIENPGYAFLKWSNGGANKELYMSLSSDIALEAIFEETAVKVLVSANDTAMGTVSYSVYWWDESSTRVDLTAKEKKGYHFVMWSDSVLTTWRSERFDSDTSLIAIFAPNIYKVTVKTADATMGSAKAESDSVAYNTTVKLTATAADGYKFVMWSDSVTDNPRNLLVLGDTTVTAIFEKGGNGSAVVENEVNALNIFAYGNTIVIENADAEIRVFDVMGHLVTISNDENAEIKINDTGVYIVKVGNIVKRVMIQ